MNELLQLVADQHNVSVSEVRHEIEAAIHYAIHSDNPKAQQFWSQICCDGEEPTPEEVIKFICDMIAA